MYPDQSFLEHLFESITMESSTRDGLTVIYDEENAEFTFDWDENTHPEYNFLKGLTEEKLADMLMDHLKKLEAEVQDEE